MNCISYILNKGKFCFLLLISVFCTSAAVAQDIDALLDTLDVTLAEGHRYVDVRRSDIAVLKTELEHAVTDEERYSLAGRLREKYNSFDIDSALYFANEKMRIARRIGNISYINDARMNLAEMSGIQGK